MKKVSPPVAVAMVVIAVLLLGFVIFRNVKGSDTGDVSALASEVKNATPKDAPPMPAGVNPTQGAMMAGGKK